MSSGRRDFGSGRRTAAARGERAFELPLGAASVLEGYAPVTSHQGGGGGERGHGYNEGTRT